jgi:hypothetical protein
VLERPGPPQLSRLEEIALAAGMWTTELRPLLQKLIDEASRDRAAKHARANGQIDKKIGVESVPVSVPDSPDLS